MEGSKFAEIHGTPAWSILVQPIMHKMEEFHPIVGEHLEEFVHTWIVRKLRELGRAEKNLLRFGDTFVEFGITAEALEQELRQIGRQKAESAAL